MDIFSVLTRLLQGGLGHLAAYLAAYVLLCLLPEFSIAGGITTLSPKETRDPLLGMQYT